MSLHRAAARRAPGSARPPAFAGLLCAAVAVALLPACAWMPFTNRDKASKANSCNEPQFYEQAQTVPPLRIPVGLDGLNTRSALKIPDLREPEAPRKLSDSCLEDPPKYSNAQLLPPPKESKREKRSKAGKETPAAAPAVPAG